MTFIQWMIVVFLIAFVVPFFVYLFSRLQMTAWLNALSDFSKKKDTEIDDDTSEEDEE